MAEFSIREMEGMRQIRIDIYNETVRARRGALSNMRGQYTADAAAAVSARSLSLGIYQRGPDQTLLHGHRFDPATTIARWLSHPHRGQRRAMDT